MGIVDNALIGASGNQGYNLQRSLRLRSSASASLSRTFGSPTNNKIWTISVWAKRGNIGSRNFIAGTNTTGGVNAFYFDWDSDALEFGEYTSSWQWRLVTSQVFRDPSAWYHIVVAVDTTQATSSNRVKMYVNGSQVTAFSTASYPTQNLNTYWNQSGQAARFGEMNGASLYYDGYLAEINFIDGQALTPSSFGSTNTLTGVWQPAPYSGGSYGTNGFELQFTDNSALTTSSNVGLGKDFSGNGNYWITNNISITAGTTYDSMTDVPTLTSPTAANFAVLNPLFNSNITLAAGNLNASNGAVSASVVPATIGVSSGKWYWEATATSANNNFGIISSTDRATMTFVGQTSTSFSYYGPNGNKYTNAAATSYGSSYTTNDVIGVALDMTAGTLTFYKNGISQGTAFTGLSGTYFPASGNDGVVTSAVFNFGQRPFAYTPPTGFVALNTFNLPNSTIVKGNTVMDATLWTGNGGTQSIVNAAGFKPDFVWVKARSANYNNILEDSVRGAGKSLQSNTTGAEIGNSGDLIGSFNSNGFTVNNTYLGSTDPSTNGNTSTFVGWQWQAGQGTTSSNTSGTITSTVSVNATAGFSVVTYTGTGANATVGHGLGVAPQFMIFKIRNAADGWGVYHVSMGNTQTMYLESTSAAVTSNTYWNNTSPTSSVFSVGTWGRVNNSGNTYVAYCWTPIAGYSVFGSYTGNGSADGTFVYTGLRARWLCVKRTDSTGDWVIFDTARGPYNQTPNGLFPNLSSAEDSSAIYDIVSNGFKARSAGSAYNVNGATYIYMAFAENPFKNALAR